MKKSQKSIKSRDWTLTTGFAALSLGFFSLALAGLFLKPVDILAQGVGISVAFGLGLGTGAMAIAGNKQRIAEIVRSGFWF